MDSIRQILSQYFQLFSQRTVAEKVALAAISLLLVGGFGVLISRNMAGSYDALSWGKVFTTEELAVAEQALRDANLNDFRRDGQRILVPRSEAPRYNAALVTAGSLPANSASELEKQLEKTNVFTSRDQLQALKEVALEKELSRVIRAVPEIEDASVRWARSQSSGWLRSKAKVTATVAVRPKKGRELSKDLVQSLRSAVANMVPDLTVADVTVFDQSTGMSYTADKPGDPFDSRVVQRIRDFSREYEQRIRQALDYIPEVLVTVHVDLDNILRSGETNTKVNPKDAATIQQVESSRNETSRDAPVRAEPGTASNRPMSLETRPANEKNRTVADTNSQTIQAPSWTVTETELLAAMPKAVKVSVSIPRDYYRSVALKRGLAEGTSESEKKEFEKTVDAIAKEEESKVRSTAKTLIPVGSPEEAVHVTSVVRIAKDVPAPSASIVEKGTQLVTEWGGLFAIAGFAIWALRMLNRSMPALPELPPMPRSTATAVGESQEAEAPTSATRRVDLKDMTPRDQLQVFAKEDPEATAAVIEKWLQQLK